MNSSFQGQPILRDEFQDGAILISTIRLPDLLAALNDPELGGESPSEYPYESIVVVDDDWYGAEQPCYRTLEEAQVGHQALVDRWRDARPAYCFDCSRDVEGRGWILENGDTYCVGSRGGGRNHRMCSECLDAYHCQEHPNWCLECSDGSICDYHRTEEI